MSDIIAVATHEFSEKGLAGRASTTSPRPCATSKRMIYYYFGSKGLYVRCSKRPTGASRAIEAGLHLEDLAPEDDCASWSASPSTTSSPIPTSSAW